MVKYSEKSKYFSTPHQISKINIYIPGQKGWLYLSKIEKIKMPPYIAPNIAGDFPTYGLLFDMGADPYGT